MYLFDNLSSSSVDKFASARLKSMSSALALPVSRGRHAKLIVNFSHESDVTSLDPFLFYYCVPHKIRRGILLTTNADIRHLLDSLVSALAVYATAFRSRLSLSHYSHYPSPFSPSPLSNILRLQFARLKSPGGFPSSHAPYSKEPGTPTAVTSTRTQCVLLCFIKPILGNRYGPGVNDRNTNHTHTYMHTHTHARPFLMLLPFLLLLVQCIRPVLAVQQLSNRRQCRC